MGEDITVNSARKFFGVFDGAYLYCNKKLAIELKREISFDKYTHLLKRIDKNASEAYIDFKNNSLIHQNSEMKIISNLRLRT